VGKTIEDLEHAVEMGATIAGITLTANAARSGLELHLGGERLTWDVDLPVALRALTIVATARAPKPYRRRRL
jgi:hypothetical protein